MQTINTAILSKIVHFRKTPLFKRGKKIVFRMDAPNAQLLGSIRKDSKVKIKRSNGVIHEAVVIRLEPQNKTFCVHVEWFENQDIKG
jgi:hypothetical protein